MLANVTGADVAANEDATGNPSVGGNWRLGVRSGEVTAQVLELTELQTTLADNTAPYISYRKRKGHCGRPRLPRL